MGKNEDTSKNAVLVKPLIVKGFEYPEWYNEKHLNFYNDIIKRTEKLYCMNIESAKYYDKLNLYIFAPSISLTAICSIASFLSTSDFLSENTKTGFSVSVGILTVLSTAIQSLASTCQYKSRAEAFRISADKYEQLLTKIRFESTIPSNENFLEELEEAILEIQGNNIYFPPEKINTKYNIHEL
jgi:hypothetical protein